MARETIKARDARVGALLADYDARKRELRKAAAAVKEIEDQVAELESGTYGDWILSRSTPREILNQREAKDALTRAGIEIPTTMSKAPLTVTSRHTA
jgi:cell division protein FtsB